jgi:predicted ribosome quality control (RQC) complex YloA/Tae2 family protein
MVFYFTACDGTLLYMGKDKFENEDLIKYGWPEDVWFHVDNLSSAHVYARLPPGETFTMEAGLPDDLVRDCAQLVKANSIEGVKKASVVVIYTPWSNLKKDGGMAAGQVRGTGGRRAREGGPPAVCPSQLPAAHARPRSLPSPPTHPRAQVGFFNERLVKKFIVAERDKEVLKRLGKSKEEKYPDFARERQARDEEERAAVKAGMRERSKAERALEEARKKEKEERSYDRLFNAAAKKEEGGAAPRPAEDVTAAKSYEEDFM